jgi:MoaA/NifB/PqqE/SkfB family radical SAM enzyme
MPIVFFGGLGEPLFHPKTIEWIAAIKGLGARVELITNGTTLTEKRSRELIASGLDVLWVSIDGASSQSYADLRLGAELPAVIQNLARLRKMRPGGHFPRPTIGIAFVAMKRNIHELQAVIKIGRRVGAKLFSVSNVMPYTEAMQAERLYTKVLHNIAYLSSPWLPTINLTKMDVDDTTREAFYQALNSGCNVTYAGNNFSGANDVCNFIESGTMSVAWDGGISPCWPLMHTHTSYLHGKEHRTRRHTIGFVQERSLLDLWLDPEYVLYRQKVQSFGFAPCTYCGGCDLSEANDEDCIGNEFPACGSCLWSQGLIQCP